MRFFAFRWPETLRNGRAACARELTCARFDSRRGSKKMPLRRVPFEVIQPSRLWGLWRVPLVSSLLLVSQESRCHAENLVVILQNLVNFAFCVKENVLRRAAVFRISGKLELARQHRSLHRNTWPVSVNHSYELPAQGNSAILGAALVQPANERKEILLFLPPGWRSPFFRVAKSPRLTLSLLVWEGYADTSFIQGFEATCHCKVVAAYMGSSDELVAKLRGGAASNYDVISPSSDVATMLTRSGLVAPLDLSKIPNYSQVSPTLTSMPLVKEWRTGLWRSAHLGTESPAVRQDCVRAEANHLGRALGSEIQGQALALGRSLVGLHGRAGARIRQAGPDGDL